MIAKLTTGFLRFKSMSHFCSIEVLLTSTQQRSEGYTSEATLLLWRQLFMIAIVTILYRKLNSAWSHSDCHTEIVKFLWQNFSFENFCWTCLPSCLKLITSTTFDQINQSRWRSRWHNWFSLTQTTINEPWPFLASLGYATSTLTKVTHDIFFKFVLKIRLRLFIFYIMLKFHLLMPYWLVWIRHWESESVNFTPRHFLLSQQEL